MSGIIMPYYYAVFQWGTHDCYLPLWRTGMTFAFTDGMVVCECERMYAMAVLSQQGEDITWRHWPTRRSPDVILSYDDFSMFTLRDCYYESDFIHIREETIFDKIGNFGDLL